jgi:DNA replication and repair protein RecF
VLLLDDVFSELDPDRTAALVANLPRGQALLTTAGVIPEGMDITRIVKLEGGRFTAQS